MDPTFCLPRVQVNIKIIKKNEYPLNVLGQNDFLQLFIAKTELNTP